MTDIAGHPHAGDHLRHLTDALAAALSPVMEIDRMSVATMDRMGRPINLGRLGPGAVPVHVTGWGWGRELERHRVRLLTGYDPTLTPERSTDEGVDLLACTIQTFRDRRDAAAAAGLDRPLEGDMLESTAHLLVDRDAANAVVAWCGSPVAAREWLSGQMRLRREQAQRRIARTSTHGTDAPLARARVLLDLHRLSLRFSPPAREPLPRVDGDIPSGPLWEDDVLLLDDHLPETVLAGAAGRTVGDLVAGTAFGSRPIEHAERIEDGRRTRLRMAPAWERLDDLIPTMPA
jgi:hypothetical protein